MRSLYVFHVEIRETYRVEHLKIFDELEIKKNGNGFDCPVMNILIRYTSVPYQKNPAEQIHW